MWNVEKVLNDRFYVVRKQRGNILWNSRSRRKSDLLKRNLVWLDFTLKLSLSWDLRFSRQGKYSGFLLLGVDKLLFNREASKFREIFFCIFSLKKWSLYGPCEYFCREVYGLLPNKICSLRRSQTAAHSNNNRISFRWTLEKTWWFFIGKGSCDGEDRLELVLEPLVFIIRISCYNFFKLKICWICNTQERNKKCIQNDGRKIKGYGNLGLDLSGRVIWKWFSTK